MPADQQTAAVCPTTKRAINHTVKSTHECLCSMQYIKYLQISLTPCLEKHTEEILGDYQCREKDSPLVTR